MGKTTYAKLIKWPKITFRGPILVPEVPFWEFWGLVCGLRILIQAPEVPFSVPPKWLKTPVLTEP